MWDKDNILTSPKEIMAEPYTTAPLHLILDDPRKPRWRKLLVATIFLTVLVVVGGATIWIWGVHFHHADVGFWHVSLVSMLFWLGVTQGMVAISALLRIGHASWRYPLNRLLDIASLYGLWVIALLPFLGLCRNQIEALGASTDKDDLWRFAGGEGYFFDAVAIGTAFLAGWMLLYLTSLPDFAILRDMSAANTIEKKLYTWLCNRLWGGKWIGSGHQWRVLRRAEGVLVVGVLVSFVASQTVLGWDFQLADARDWDSSIFAPLFTLGSLLGGLALTTLVMTQVNRILRGSKFIEVRHYDNIGRFMIALGLVWFYFRFCDFLTAWYGHTPDEWVLEQNRVSAFPILAGLMVFGCFVAPVFGNMIGAVRKSVGGLCTISVCVLVGLAIQRYLDTVPTFAPDYPLRALVPTLPGIIVFASLGSMFVLTYLAAARWIPIMSWWGTTKDRTRTAQLRLGNEVVPVMVEDPPVWET